MSQEQIASLDQVARVSASRLDGGPADGMRVIDVTLVGGLSFRVLPDRGLDIGSSWCWHFGIGYRTVKRFGHGPSTRSSRGTFANLGARADNNVLARSICFAP